ncbi:hypothetical protein [Halobacteriaceae bacterium SHR40]|uniref:hypothetical protein n=1 Tax=Halovenus amylolytica TaxID=2500550 RepID=UPI000FE38935
MIEIIGLLGVALFQVTITVFGYYSAIGHINRMLDIEEPESPQILQNMRKSLFSDEALTVADIDSIDDWDAFETARDDEIEE